MLPDVQWRTAFQHLKTADVFYKMAGYGDRGFTLMKKFAQELCDQEDVQNSEAAKAGIIVYKEVFPLLFEDDNMTMNYDMLETYPKTLAKACMWKEFVLVRKRIMKHYRDIKKVDHRTRRIFVELVCIQMFTEDFGSMEQTCDDFYQEVGGNPY